MSSLHDMRVSHSDPAITGGDPSLGDALERVFDAQQALVVRRLDLFAEEITAKAKSLVAISVAALAGAIAALVGWFIAIAGVINALDDRFARSALEIGIGALHIGAVSRSSSTCSGGECRRFRHELVFGSAAGLIARSPRGRHLSGAGAPKIPVIHVEGIRESPYALACSLGGIRKGALPRRGAGSGARDVRECGLEPSHLTFEKLPTVAWLAAIVDSSYDAIVSKSLDGRILSWNAGAERLFGYSAEEAIGQSILLIIPPERASEETEILARLRVGDRIGHFETVRRAKGGRRVDVSLTISPVHDASGRVIGASKVARDITLEKRAREVLRESDRIKDEFLAIFAHELRNRLAPISSAVETLIIQGPIVPEAKPALDVIDRQTAQMVRLVDDLLDVSRIARNELPLRKKRVKLQDVLADALEVSRPLIDEREQGLTVSEAPRATYLHADPMRLAQAFTNLLNNAAKYTDRGGRIWLTAERDGDEAVISVRDNGMGIAPEMMSHLFEMFVQVDSSAKRSQRGLGVGLTLVKRIVELHGGTVEARSDGLGKGSEFVVRLPVAVQRPRVRRARASRAVPAAVGNRRRILVVDDDRDLVTSLAMVLTSMGNEVRTAHDGAEALQIATEFRPHAVALDVSLPTMSGFDVVRQLRQQCGGEKIIAIALTGWAHDEARERAREAGFDHYVVKPIEASALAKLFDAAS